MAALVSLPHGLMEHILARTFNSFIRVTAVCMSRTSKPLAILPPPKKPASAFIKFLADKRAKTTEENQGLSNRDIIKTIAEMWRVLNPEEKQKYLDNAKTEMLKFTEEYSIYMAELTTDQVKTLQEICKDKGKNMIKEKNKFLTELGKPPRNKSSYAIFLQSKMKDRGNTKMIEFAKIIASEWKTLSEVEKQPYEALAKVDHTRYLKDSKEWEDKMMSEGKSEVIQNLNKSKNAKKPRSREKEETKKGN